MPRHSFQSAVFGFKTIALLLALAITTATLALGYDIVDSVAAIFGPGGENANTAVLTNTPTNTPSNTPTPCWTAGCPDYSFGVSGIVTTEVGNGEDTANAIAVQPDSKIVSAGVTNDGTRGYFALARHNTNGSLDTSFGVGGKVVTAIQDKITYEAAYAVAIQPDGKIVAAGVTDYRFALARFDSKGSLDSSFGIGGKVVTQISSGLDSAYSVAIQLDGKIVAAGDANSDFGVARYNSDGSLDTSFGVGGKVITPIGTNTDRAYAMAIQPDGKMIAAGYSYRPQSSADFALTRYNSDGSLDTSFDGDGKVVTIGGMNEQIRALALQSDGKIVAAGNQSCVTCPQYEVFALARYNTDGSLDTSFNGGGKVTTSFGANWDYANGVAIQHDGKIVAAGAAFTVTSSASSHDLALTRYNVDGSLDASFGAGGMVVTSVGSGNDAVNAVAIQPDGKIVAAGYASNGANSDFALVRYLNATTVTPTGTPTNTATITATITATATSSPTSTATACGSPGTLDVSFNGNGTVVTPVGNSGYANSAALQSDGKIVVAGYTGSSRDFALVRFNPDGTLDTTFNGNGQVVTPVVNGDDLAYAVAIQADGKILEAGVGNGAFALVRYNSDGTLDTTFNGTGKVITPIAGYSVVYSLAIQSDGKIVAGGQANVLGHESFGVARYNTNGTLDTSFNGTGSVITAVGTVGGEYLRSVAIQPDGKIVGAGTIGSLGAGSNSDIGLVRYNVDGTLDTTFNGSGKVITAIGNSNDVANSAALQTDGKIVVGGATITGQTIDSYDLTLVRYNIDGSLDPTFNGTGHVITAIDGFDGDGANSIAIQADGRIVAAGSGLGDFALVRYDPNGSLDTTFNGTGIIITPIGSFGDSASSVVIQPGGRIIAAGNSSGLLGSNNQFAVAAYYQNACPAATATSTPTNTATLTPTVTATATPTSTPATAAVTVGTDPADLAFSVDSVVYHSTQTFNWFPGSIHTLSTESPQGAGSGTQYVWRSWSDGGSPSHPIIVPSEAEAHYTASFTTQYLLTMCCDTDLWVVNPDTGYYNAGQTVQIGGGGVGNSGFSLAEWHGQGSGSYTGFPNAAAVTMNGPISEYAVFEGPAPFPGYGNPAPICTTLGSSADIFPSVITVSGATNNVGSVRVTLKGLRHQAPDNLDFLLVGPQGQAFILMSDAGGIAPISQTGVNLTFSDTAGQIVPDNEAPVVGYYEPTSWEPGQQSFPSPAPSTPYNEPGSVLGGSGAQTLDGVFGGTNANGVWKLYARDDGGTFGTGTTGCVDGGWRIEFTHSMTASLSGRVTTANGQGIRNAKLVISGGSLPAPLVAATGSLGYFRFEGLATGERYVVTVYSKRFTFSTPTRVITLADNVVDADFISDPQGLVTLPAFPPGIFR